MIGQTKVQSISIHPDFFSLFGRSESTQSLLDEAITLLANSSPDVLPSPLFSSFTKLLTSANNEIRLDGLKSLLASDWSFKSTTVLEDIFGPEFVILPLTTAHYEHIEKVYVTLFTFLLLSLHPMLVKTWIVEPSLTPTYRKLSTQLFEKMLGKDSSSSTPSSSLSSSSSIAEHLGLVSKVSAVYEEYMVNTLELCPGLASDDSINFTNSFTSSFTVYFANLLLLLRARPTRTSLTTTAEFSGLAQQFLSFMIRFLSSELRLQSHMESSPQISTIQISHDQHSYLSLYKPTSILIAKKERVISLPQSPTIWLKVLANRYFPSLHFVPNAHLELKDSGSAFGIPSFTHLRAGMLIIAELVMMLLNQTELCFVSNQTVTQETKDLVSIVGMVFAGVLAQRRTPLSKDILTQITYSTVQILRLTVLIDTETKKDDSESREVVEANRIFEFLFTQYPDSIGQLPTADNPHNTFLGFRVGYFSTYFASRPPRVYLGSNEHVNERSNTSLAHFMGQVNLTNFARNALAVLPLRSLLSTLHFTNDKLERGWVVADEDMYEVHSSVVDEVRTSFQAVNQVLSANQHSDKEPYSLTLFTSVFPIFVVGNILSEDPDLKTSGVLCGEMWLKYAQKILSSLDPLAPDFASKSTVLSRIIFKKIAAIMEALYVVLLRSLQGASKSFATLVQKVLILWSQLQEMFLATYQQYLKDPSLPKGYAIDLEESVDNLTVLSEKLLSNALTSSTFTRRELIQAITLSQSNSCAKFFQVRPDLLDVLLSHCSDLAVSSLASRLFCHLLTEQSTVLNLAPIPGKHQKKNSKAISREDVFTDHHRTVSNSISRHLSLHQIANDANDVSDVSILNGIIDTNITMAIAWRLDWVSLLVFHLLHGSPLQRNALCTSNGIVSYILTSIDVSPVTLQVILSVLAYNAIESPFETENDKEKNEIVYRTIRVPWCLIRNMYKDYASVGTSVNLSCLSSLDQTLGLFTTIRENPSIAPISVVESVLSVLKVARLKALRTSSQVEADMVSLYRAVPSFSALVTKNPFYSPDMSRDRFSGSSFSSLMWESLLLHEASFTRATAWDLISGPPISNSASTVSELSAVLRALPHLSLSSTVVSQALLHSITNFLTRVSVYMSSGIRNVGKPSMDTHETPSSSTSDAPTTSSVVIPPTTSSVATPSTTSSDATREECFKFLSTVCVYLISTCVGGPDKTSSDRCAFGLNVLAEICKSAMIVPHMASFAASPFVTSWTLEERKKPLVPIPVSSGTLSRINVDMNDVESELGSSLTLRDKFCLRECVLHDNPLSGSFLASLEHTWDGISSRLTSLLCTSQIFSLVDTLSVGISSSSLELSTIKHAISRVVAVFRSSDLQSFPMVSSTFRFLLRVYLVPVLKMTPKVTTTSVNAGLVTPKELLFAFFEPFLCSQKLQDMFAFLPISTSSENQALADGLTFLLFGLREMLSDANRKLIRAIVLGETESVAFSSPLLVLLEEMKLSYSALCLVRSVLEDVLWHPLVQYERVRGSTRVLAQSLLDELMNLAKIFFRLHTQTDASLSTLSVSSSSSQASLFDAAEWLSFSGHLEFSAAIKVDCRGHLYIDNTAMSSSNGVTNSDVKDNFDGNNMNDLSSISSTSSTNVNSLSDSQSRVLASLSWLSLRELSLIFCAWSASPVFVNTHENADEETMGDSSSTQVCSEESSTALSLDTLTDLSLDLSYRSFVHGSSIPSHTGLFGPLTLKRIGSLMLTLLLASKHMGVHELAESTLQALCTTFSLRSSPPSVRALPSIWLRQIVSYVKKSGHAEDKSWVRRGAGLSFCALALLRGQYFGSGASPGSVVVQSHASTQSQSQSESQTPISTQRTSDAYMESDSVAEFTCLAREFISDLSDCFIEAQEWETRRAKKTQRLISMENDLMEEDEENIESENNSVVSMIKTIATGRKEKMTLDPGQEWKVKVHVLNLFRALLRDRSVASVMTFSQISHTLELCMFSFTSSNWNVRNSALLAFAAVSARAFNTRQPSTLSSDDPMYPSSSGAKATFETEAEAETESASRDGLYGCLSSFSLSQSMALCYLLSPLGTSFGFTNTSDVSFHYQGISKFDGGAKSAFTMAAFLENYRSFATNLRKQLSSLIGIDENHISRRFAAHEKVDEGSRVPVFILLKDMFSRVPYISSRANKSGSPIMPILSILASFTPQKKSIIHPTSYNSFQIDHMGLVDATFQLLGHPSAHVRLVAAQAFTRFVYITGVNSTPYDFAQGLLGCLEKVATQLGVSADITETIVTASTDSITHVVSVKQPRGILLNSFHGVLSALNILLTTFPATSFAPSESLSSLESFSVVTTLSQDEKAKYLASPETREGLTALSTFFCSAYDTLRKYTQYLTIQRDTLLPSTAVGLLKITANRVLPLPVLQVLFETSNTLFVFCRCLWELGTQSCGLLKDADKQYPVVPLIDAMTHIASWIAPSIKAETYAPISLSTSTNTTTISIFPAIASLYGKNEIWGMILRRCAQKRYSDLYVVFSKQQELLPTFPVELWSSTLSTVMNEYVPAYRNVIIEEMAIAVERITTLATTAFNDDSMNTTNIASLYSSLSKAIDTTILSDLTVLNTSSVSLSLSSSTLYSDILSILATYTETQKQVAITSSSTSTPACVLRLIGALADFTHMYIQTRGMIEQDVHDLHYEVGSCVGNILDASVDSLHTTFFTACATGSVPSQFFTLEYLYKNDRVSHVGLRTVGKLIRCTTLQLLRTIDEDIKTVEGARFPKRMRVGNDVGIDGYPIAESKNAVLQDILYGAIVFIAQARIYLAQEHHQHLRFTTLQALVESGIAEFPAFYTCPSNASGVTDVFDVSGVSNVMATIKTLREVVRGMLTACVFHDLNESVRLFALSYLSEIDSPKAIEKKNIATKHISTEGSQKSLLSTFVFEQLLGTTPTSAVVSAKNEHTTGNDLEKDKTSSLISTLLLRVAQVTPSNLYSILTRNRAQTESTTLHTHFTIQHVYEVNYLKHDENVEIDAADHDILQNTKKIYESSLNTANITSILARYLDHED